MVQERYNAQWIAQNGVGVVLRSFTDIASGIDTLLGDADRTQRFRQQVCSLNNRALFEIPDIFDSLIARRQANLVTRLRHDELNPPHFG